MMVLWNDAAKIHAENEQTEYCEGTECWMAKVSRLSPQPHLLSTYHPKLYKRRSFFGPQDVQSVGVEHKVENATTGR